jgi:hypothetical protein
VSKTTDDAYERAELPAVYDCHGKLVAPALGRMIVQRPQPMTTPEDRSLYVMHVTAGEEQLLCELRERLIRPMSLIEIVRTIKRPEC